MVRKNAILILIVLMLIWNTSYAEEEMNNWIGIVSSILNGYGSCESEELWRTEDEYSIEQTHSISYTTTDDSCQIIARFIIKKKGWFQKNELEAAIFYCLIPPEPSKSYAFCNCIAGLPTACILKEEMPERDYDEELEKIQQSLLASIRGDESDRYEYYFPNGARMWIDTVQRPFATLYSDTVNYVTVSVWYR